MAFRVAALSRRMIADGTARRGARGEPSCWSRRTRQAGLGRCRRGRPHGPAVPPRSGRGPRRWAARSARFRGWPCYFCHSRYSAPRGGSRNGGKDRRLLRTACPSPSGVAGIAGIAGGTGWNRGTGDGARPEGRRSWHHRLPAVPARLPLHLGPGRQPAPPAVAVIPGPYRLTALDPQRPFTYGPSRSGFRREADIPAGIRGSAALRPSQTLSASARHPESRPSFARRHQLL